MDAKASALDVAQELAFRTNSILDEMEKQWRDIVPVKNAQPSLEPKTSASGSNKNSTEFIETATVGHPGEPEVNKEKPKVGRSATTVVEHTPKQSDQRKLTSRSDHDSGCPIRRREKKKSKQRKKADELRRKLNELEKEIHALQLTRMKVAAVPAETKDNAVPVKTKVSAVPKKAGSSASSPSRKPPSWLLTERERKELYGSSVMLNKRLCQSSRLEDGCQPNEVIKKQLSETGRIVDRGFLTAREINEKIELWKRLKGTKDVSLQVSVPEDRPKTDSHAQIISKFDEKLSSLLEQFQNKPHAPLPLSRSTALVTVSRHDHLEQSERKLAIQQLPKIDIRGEFTKQSLPSIQINPQSPPTPTINTGITFYKSGVQPPSPRPKSVETRSSYHASRIPTPEFISPERHDKGIQACFSEDSTKTDNLEELTKKYKKRSVTVKKQELVLGEAVTELLRKVEESGRKCENYSLRMLEKRKQLENTEKTSTDQNITSVSETIKQDTEKSLTDITKNDYESDFHVESLQSDGSVQISSKRPFSPLEGNKNAFKADTNEMEIRNQTKPQRPLSSSRSHLSRSRSPMPSSRNRRPPSSSRYHHSRSKSPLQSSINRYSPSIPSLRNRRPLSSSRHHHSRSKSPMPWSINDHSPSKSPIPSSRNRHPLTSSRRHHSRSKSPMPPPINHRLLSKSPVSSSSISMSDSSILDEQMKRLGISPSRSFSSLSSNPPRKLKTEKSVGNNEILYRKQNGRYVVVRPEEVPRVNIIVPEIVVKLPEAALPVEPAACQTVKVDQVVQTDEGCGTMTSCEASSVVEQLNLRFERTQFLLDLMDQRNEMRNLETGEFFLNAQKRTETGSSSSCNSNSRGRHRRRRRLSKGELPAKRADSPDEFFLPSKKSDSRDSSPSIGEVFPSNGR